MNKRFALMLAVLCAASLPSWAQTPVVSGVTMSQGAVTSPPGTQVTINYTLASTGGNCTIDAFASADGGNTFSLPVKTATGDIGPGVSPGNRSIVWDVDADYPNDVIPSSYVRIVATLNNSNANANCITDGTMPNGSTAWTLGTGWTISGNRAQRAANATLGQISEAPANQTSQLQVGETYNVTYALTVTAGAGFRVGLGTALGPVRSGSTTYTDTITCAGNGTISFQPQDAATVGTVDTVSVVRAERVTNGLFNTNANNWALGTGWTYGTGAVNHTANATIANLTQTAANQAVPLVVGNAYTVTYTLSGVGGAGGFRVGLGTAMGTARTANGTYTEVIKCAGTTDLVFVPQSATAAGTIDGVSIISADCGDRVANGDFASALTPWTSAGSWAYANVVAHIYGSAAKSAGNQNSLTEAFANQLNGGLRNGTTYAVTFSVTTVPTGGNFRALLGTQAGTNRNTRGTFSQIITSNANSISIGVDANAVAGTVDGVSVRPASAVGVGTSAVAVTLDTQGPTVTLADAVGQADPTNASPINFTATFSESGILNFINSDITLSGTANPGSASITGAGPYNVAVSGMTANGTVIPSIPAGVCWDAMGNANQASTGTPSVTYDTTPPTGTVSINSGDSHTNSATVLLTLSTTDALSPVASMRFSNDNSSWSTWEAYGTGKTWGVPTGDGVKTVYVQYRDAAGNATTATISDTITLDTTGPTGTVSINAGATYANSTSVTLTLTENDGLGSGTFSMRFSNDNSSWSAWEDYASNKIWTLATGDGAKTVYVQYQDYLGNVSAGSYSDGITLDTTAPTGTISINGGAAYTTTTSVTLTLSASDALSGMSQMRFSNDNSVWSTWEAYATSKAWTLATGDGNKTVYVQYSDISGNTTSATISDTVLLDTTAPTGTISINGGAAATNSTSVTLTLLATDAGTGPSQMRFSNDNSVWSTWEAYATSKAWTLTTGDGTKTVYVQYRDSAGISSAGTISDTIVYETVAPAGTISIAGGATYANTTAVTLTLSATDGGSGVGQMRFSNDNSVWSTWEAYSTSKAWTLVTGDGAKTVYVQYQDNAGNGSTGTISDTVTLDTTAPTGTVSIAGGASYAATTSVTLTLSGTDGGSGMNQMRFSNDNSVWSAWEAYGTSKAWTLSTGDGTKTVYVQYSDTVNNATSATISDTIALDTTVPTGTVSINAGAAATSSTSVTLTLSATDTGSGMSQMRFSNDNSVWSTWEAYGTSKAWTLASGDGVKTVYVQYQDNAGLSSSGTLSDTIVYDTVAPTGTVSVAGGASATASTSVTLSLSATDGGSGMGQMRFSNDNAIWSAWETYAVSKAWTLSTGDGNKTVYVQYRDNANNPTAGTISDGILLDTAAPTGSLSINGGAASTGSSAATLTLSATDGGSGVSQMRFSNDNAVWSTWETYATSKSWTLSAGEGTKTVYVQYQDGAGNVNSSAITDTILLDTTAPSGTISIDGGAAYTTDASVSLTLSASDAGSGLGQMRFSNDNSSWSTWEAYGTSKTWSLAAGDGAKTVYVQYKDTLDNTSTGTISDGILLDTTAPSGTLVINGGAAYTNQTSVTLTLSATDSGSGVTQMRFSDDNASWTTWQAYATSKAWTLPTGEGEKTVYVQYRDAAGLIATASNATPVTLDETPPTGTLTIEGGDLYTPVVNVSLTPMASDDLSGVASMHFSNDGVSWSAWEDYSPFKLWTLTTGDGLKTVYVEYLDAAGNVSTDTISADITLDTVNPVITDVTMTQGPIASPPGTQVTITYTLTSSAGVCTVDAFVSPDQGVTHTIPVKTATGDIGEGVAPGTRTFVWDIAADCPNEQFDEATVMLVATVNTSTANPNRVANGTFTTTLAPWTATAGWAISGGTRARRTANATLAPLVQAPVDQATPILVGKTYRITYTLATVSGTGFRVALGTAQGPTRNAGGTYTDTITCAGDGTIGFIPMSAATAGLVDNVTVVLADCVTNGTFTGNSNGWTRGTGWTYGTNAVTRAPNATIANLTQTAANQTVPLVLGKVYVVTYTLTGYSGAGGFRVGLGSSMGIARTANGTYTEVIKCAGSTDIVFVPQSASAGGTIDSVSVMPSDSANRVTNGEFSAPQQLSPWTATANWIWDNTVPHHYGLASKNTSGANVLSETFANQLNGGLSVNTAYAVTYSLCTTPATGGFRALLGTAAGSTRSAAGTYSQVVTCAGNTTLSLGVTNSATLGQIDTVVVRPATEVGVGKSNTPVTLDTIPPTVSLADAAGQANPANATPVNFSATFSKDGILNFEGTDITFSGTANANAATVTGTGPYNVAVSGMSANGTVLISVPADVCWDALGNGNAASTGTPSVTYDTTPPTGTVSVAAGASFATSTAVLLSTSATDALSSVASMRFSNDNSSWSAWENYATSKTWTLTSGDGAKRVYVQYRDAAGNASSAAIYDDIVLDMSGPTGTVVIDGGATLTNQSSVTLALTATDGTGAGVFAMRFSNDNSNWSTWEDFATAKTWTLSAGDGVKTVYVQFQDFLGIVSASSYTDTITLDATPPTGTVSISAGAAHTTSTAVTLTLSATDAVSGMNQMQFSNDNSSWSAWEAYTTSKAWTLSSGDGLKTVYVHYRDNAGNVNSATISDTIQLDTSLPTGTISVNGGAAYAASASVTLTLSATDTGSGISQMRFSNDNSSWSTWENYAVSKAWTLTAGDGGKTVYVQYRDTAGNVSSGTLSDGIVLDTAAPTGTVSIDGGAAATKLTSATLTLSASDSGSGVSQMRFSNDNSIWSTWEPYATSKAWDLTAAEGVKTVYVQFQDVSGTPSSGIISDAILLDTTAPTGTVSIDGNNPSTASTSVTLTLSAADAGSGVTEMQFSNNNVSWSAWEPYATSKAWTLSGADGTKTVYVQYRDAAGNTATGTISDTILLDTTAPTGTVTVNGSDTYTNQTSVTLTLSASDSGTGVADMQFSNDNVTWSGWESYATSKTWVLTAGEGVNTVYARFRDTTGSVYTTSDTITLDQTAPTGTISIEGGAAFTASESAVLTLSGNDALSGVASMRFSNDNSLWSSWESFSLAKLWTLTPADGFKTVYVGYRDAAGNVSAGPLSASITLDTTPPLGSIFINGDAESTNSPSVTLTISVNDGTGSGVSEMRFSNDASTWSSWEPYALSRAWDIPATDGSHTVYAMFRDTVGNMTATSVADSIILDVEGASAVLDSTSPNPTNAQPIPVTLTFSDAVTGLEDSDIMVDNGSVSNLTGSGKDYQFDVTPAADGLVRIQLPQGVCLDSAGNGNKAATDLTRTYDSTPPSAVLSTTATDPTSTSPITVTVALSEAVTDLSLADLDAVDAIVTNLTGSGSNYQFDLIPSVNGVVSVSLSAGSVHDAAGNGNTVSNSLSRTFSSSRPTVAITTTAANPTNAAVIPVTVTFSAAVTGFIAGDLAVTRASVSNFAGNGAHYTFDLTPTSQGTVSVNIPQDAAQDGTSNGNMAGSFSIGYDSIPPVPTLFSTDTWSASTTTINVSVVFAETVIGFDATDLLAVNGTITHFTGSDNQYSFDLEPVAQGVVKVILSADKCEDAATNGNLAGQFVRTYDTEAPSVVLTSPADAVVTDSPIQVVAHFSEPVTGFTKQDVVVGNGSVGTFTGSGANYTFYVFPEAQGNVTVDVHANVCADTLGNKNTAALTLSRTYLGTRNGVPLAWWPLALLLAAAGFAAERRKPRS